MIEMGQYDEYGIIRRLILNVYGINVILVLTAGTQYSNAIQTDRLLRRSQSPFKRE